jgi:hypothetical protein
MCEGQDSHLFDSVAHYCGCGVAESFKVASEDELKLIEYSGFEILWKACLANLCSCCDWNNQSLRIVDDPAGRFRMFVCDNAFQATWDALSELLLLDRQVAQQFVPNDFQRAILAALDGRALKKQPLANEVCKGEGTLLYRKDGLQELREAGLVAHKNRLGFYRPDRPPADV